MDFVLIAEASSLSATLAAVWMWIVVIFKVAVALGLVIFVHELGHFLVAKMAGVKCEKFYVGFDIPIRIGPWNLPRTLFKKQWGETEYGIGIVPLGGYVKMLGQDDNPANAEREAERIRIPGGGTAEGEGGAAAEETVALDPRSYPAKSVPVRMAIISAGVVMNVIFAVIFATIAFGLGVPYTPCVIGNTIPGSPAWEKNLPLGSRVVGIGASATPHEHLRFDKDLLMNVVMTGGKEDIVLKLRRPDGAIEDVALRPRIDPASDLPSIGVSSEGSTRLAESDPVLAHLPAGQTQQPFQAGDRIVEIAVGGETYPIQEHRDLRRVLARHPHQPLTVVVERAAASGAAEPAAKQRVPIVVPPNPLRELGFSVGMGPIAAVQQRSPAQAAGLKPGDLLLSVDGIPIVRGDQYDDPAALAGPPAGPDGPRLLDGITLPQYLDRRGGTVVQIEVLRPAEGGRRVTIAAALALPETHYDLSQSTTAPMGVASLGIAYPLTDAVAYVVPGSAAEAAGLARGDVIRQAAFVPADAAAEQQERTLGFTRNEFTFGPKLNWSAVFGQMQFRLPETKVRLTVARNGGTETVTLASAPSDLWFVPTRGFSLQAQRDMHVAAGPVEAVALGVRETRESLMHVFLFLRKLFTGQVKPTHLGGPATIAVVAGSEARQGIPRLLIFLTLLSANLAIINFLPIPVLDGGHMVFLAYEGIRGKPVDEVWAMRLTMLGLTFILGLMVFVIGLDIFRIAQWVV